MHVSDPIQAACTLDGLSQQRWQSEGDIDIVPAGYNGVWIDEAPATILQVQLQPRLLQQAVQDLPPGRRSGADLRPYLQLRDTRLKTLLLALQAEAQTGYDNGRLYTESLSTALALHLTRNLAQPEEGKVLPAGFSPRQQRLLADYIESHLDQDLSLERLQTLVGLGPSQFKLLFKRSFDSAAHAYVLERRVERARQLIRANKLGLAEIALETGFVDQSHMARCLRRVLGLSATELRRS
jgi:AraC family transcriptional regulator